MTISGWIWVSRYQNVSILDFIGAKDDGSGGNNWSCKTCKTPNKSSPPTYQHTLLQAGCPSCHPTNSVKCPEGKVDIQTQKMHYTTKTTIYPQCMLFLLIFWFIHLLSARPIIPTKKPKETNLWWYAVHCPVFTFHALTALLISVLPW